MEWDKVVVYGATAGIMPHRLAEDVEEERRVLHVAITRARHAVVVLGDRSRPSMFMSEMLEDTGPRRPERVGGARAPRYSDHEDPPARHERADRRVRGERTSRAEGSPGPEGSPQAERVLEEALRDWRRKRSSHDGVPAYVVLSDKTLRAIVAARPRSLFTLREVPGIGPAKLELYGEEILGVIHEVPEDQDASLSR
jgi:DNA helicase-2/ATP-dependent DNA helicase PcrA